MTKQEIKLLTALNKIYGQYNRKTLISPDPLEVLSNYKAIGDREIAGLIASSLAYGRVEQILKAVNYVLDILGKHPKQFILKNPNAKLKILFSNFKYRFTTSNEIYNLIIGIKKTIIKHGSLNKAFLANFDKTDATVIKAQSAFIAKLIKAGGNMPSLIPAPNKKSAFKRLNLYMRWLVRKDAVDPGGWTGIDKSKLIIPLDTHMHKIALNLCLTKSKTANLKSALEITQNFARLCRQDPVKFDFALTRFGIRGELNYAKLALNFK